MNKKLNTLVATLLGILVLALAVAFSANAPRDVVYGLFSGKPLGNPPVAVPGGVGECGFYRNGVISGDEMLRRNGGVIPDHCLQGFGEKPLVELAPGFATPTSAGNLLVVPTASPTVTAQPITTKNPTNSPAKNSPASVTASPSITPTEAVTETPADLATETSTSTPTQEATETPTEMPTESTPVVTPTEAPTQATETPVVTSTPNPTQTVTATPPTGTKTPCGHKTPKVHPTKTPRSYHRHG